MAAAGLAWGAIGAAGNGLVGALAALAETPGEPLARSVRSTGNGTFVAFALPFVMQAGRADGRAWWSYAGAHAAHLSFLAAAARRHAGFSATSRYGGALGYGVVAALGASSYAPGCRPCADASRRRLHRLGEQFLFGLYGFTIVHGYLAKGRNHALYGPLAALWLVAAARGRARWAARPSEEEVAPRPRLT